MSSCGTGIKRIVKSMAMDMALDAYVKALTSRHVDWILLSKTPPGAVSVGVMCWRTRTHGLVCIGIL